ncbi:MAG: hypothetical protein K0Q63_3306, partial [Paenibacillus sp.]|nr:hypothetical protein [Paenibacillus sp.]
MYIVTNALRNVMRNRGRNALIGAIILAVIVTSVVALMISNTASGIIEDYKGRFGAEVRLQPNMEKVRAEAMAGSKDGRVMITVPSIPPEQYIAFGESDQLQSSRFMASTGVNSESMTVVDEELGRGNGMMMMGGPGMAGNNANAPMSFMMSLWGNKLTEFEEGTRELAEGKLPEQLNEAMISTELAETSGIAVGDKLSLYGELSNMPEGKREGTSYELTVVGTYYDATEPYADGAARNAYTNRRNEILTTYETVIQQLKPEMNGIRIEATYYLKEPGLLEAFAAEVYAKGLSETFDVTTDEASYNKIVG